MYGLSTMTEGEPAFSHYEVYGSGKTFASQILEACLEPYQTFEERIKVCEMALLDTAICDPAQMIIERGIKRVLPSYVGAYYIRLVIFASEEGVCQTLDGGEDVPKDYFCNAGEKGRRSFFAGANEIWMC
ncbi:hypothetical protein ACFX13_023607 [Malus domestica]